MRTKNFLMLGAVVLAGSLHAVPVNPFAPAEGFNIVVKNDFDLKSGHPEGALAVGGNLTFQGGSEVSQKYAGTYVAPGDAKGTNLIVGGQVNWASSSGQLQAGNQNGNGYVKIGGASTVHPWNPGETVINNSANANSNPRIMTRVDQDEASIKASSGFDFAAKATLFETYSSQMAGLAGTRTATDLGLNGGLTNLNNFGLDSGLNVFNLTGSQWSNIQNINWNNSFAPSLARTLLVNIDLGGLSSYNFGLPAMGLQEANAAFVLFNFYNFTGTLNFVGNSIYGSVLAPFATINKTSYQHGQSYSKGYVFNSGEVHFYSNQVTYTPPTTPPPPPPPHNVPDSSATWAGALVLGVLAALRRRTA